MEPQMHLNFLAIVLAVLAHFVIGFLWYTPIFGSVWAKEMGFSKDMNVPKSMFIKNILLNLFGNFLMAFVLLHNIQAWDPRTWGIDLEFVPPAAAAFSSALFTWLGFFVPQGLTSVTWEMKSWKLFFINTGYHLISLLAVSFILVYLN
jgi:hypothetical protein